MTKTPEDFYISSYCLDANVDQVKFENLFTTPWHGNATKPTVAKYPCTDNQVTLSVGNALKT